MKFNIKSGIAVVGVTGILALGVLGTGVVMAQGADGTPSTSDTAPVPGDHPGRPGPGPVGGALFEASGLDRQVFADGFAQGLTVGEVLTQQGLNPDTVVSDALSLIEQHLSDAVANGDMNQATADEKLSNAETMLNALLDTTPQPHHDGGPGHGRGPGLAGALFEASGLDRQVFADGFAQGLTVGEVLTQQGLNPDTVVSDALSLIEQHLSDAVANGNMDQATADEKLSNAETMLNALLDTTPQPHQDGGPGHGHGPGGPEGRHPFAGDAAAALGLTPAELRDALSDGSTLADVANSLGIDPQTVIDAMLQPILDHIDQAEADGQITSDEAAAKKAEATQRVTDLVNNGMPEGAPGHPPMDGDAPADDTTTSFGA